MLFGINVPRKFQSASILFYVVQCIPTNPYIPVYLTVSSIHRQLLRENVNRCAAKLRETSFVFVRCYNFGRNLEFGESFRHVILHFEELKRLEVERKVYPFNT